MRRYNHDRYVKIKQEPDLYAVELGRKRVWKTKYRKTRAYRDWCVRYYQQPNVKKACYARAKRYKATHREQINAWSRTYRKDWYHNRGGKERYRLNRLRTQYGEEAYQWYLAQPKKCAKCGSSEQIHIHHIDQNSANNVISNLALLCNSCHQSFHRYQPNPVRLYYEWLRAK